MYQEYETFVRKGDTFIPKDLRQIEYQAFLEWKQSHKKAKVLPDPTGAEESTDPMQKAASWLTEQPPEVIEAIVMFVQNKGQM